MNTLRTKQDIPTKIVQAIDHVRTKFPDVDLVVFNDVGRWCFMSEDFDAPSFTPIGIIDLNILEEASEIATWPSVHQAYTSEEYTAECTETRLPCPITEN